MVAMTAAGMITAGMVAAATGNTVVVHMQGIMRMYMQGVVVHMQRIMVHMQGIKGIVAVVFDRIQLG